MLAKMTRFSAMLGRVLVGHRSVFKLLIVRAFFLPQGVLKVTLACQGCGPRQ